MNEADLINLFLESSQALDSNFEFFSDGIIRSDCSVLPYNRKNSLSGISDNDIALSRFHDSIHDPRGDNWENAHVDSGSAGRDEFRNLLDKCKREPSCSRGYIS
jgi:hypothetical protein